MYKIIFNLQIVCKNKLGLPTNSEFYYWLKNVFIFFKKNIEITIRIVDECEISLLNFNYRGKKKYTNVLSFSFNTYYKFNKFLLGELIICRKILEKESFNKLITLKNYWAYIIIHGSLHLLGYNHISKKDFIDMKLLEIFFLNDLYI